MTKPEIQSSDFWRAVCDYNEQPEDQKTGLGRFLNERFNLNNDMLAATERYYPVIDYMECHYIKDSEWNTWFS